MDLLQDVDMQNHVHWQGKVWTSRTASVAADRLMRMDDAPQIAKLHGSLNKHSALRIFNAV